MNPQKTALRIAAIATLGWATSALASACSGDDNNNPAPNVDSGGQDQTSSSSSGGGSGSSSGGSSGSSSGGSSSGGSSGSSSGGDDGGMNIQDTGACVSDSSVCNSCYTDAQAAKDPYNACTPYAVNCTPFNNSGGGFLASDGGVYIVP